MRDVDALSNSFYDELGRNELADPVDYLAVALLVESSVQKNFCDSGAQHREGFVRALAELIQNVMDGNDVPRPQDGWDPLASSAAAFSAPQLAALAISAARGSSRQP
ncbi:MAG TPA: hypothetical protein VF453_09445 [Burkholderiaceae bacterium]